MLVLKFVIFETESNIKCVRYLLTINNIHIQNTLEYKKDMHCCVCAYHSYNCTIRTSTLPRGQNASQNTTKHSASNVTETTHKPHVAVVFMFANRMRSRITQRKLRLKLYTHINQTVSQLAAKCGGSHGECIFGVYKSKSVVKPTPSWETWACWWHYKLLRLLAAEWICIANDDDNTPAFLPALLLLALQSTTLPQFSNVFVCDCVTYVGIHTPDIFANTNSYQHLNGEWTECLRVRNGSSDNLPICILYNANTPELHFYLYRVHCSLSIWTFCMLLFTVRLYE